MDLQTYQELNRRVLILESALTVDDKPLSPTLTEQLESIKVQWNQAVVTHPTLKKLYDLSEAVSNRGKSGMVREDSCSPSPSSDHEDISIDLKTLTISILADAIAEAHKHLCRLDIIDKTTALNPFHGLPLDLYVNDVSAVRCQAGEIKRLAKNYDLVLLKSMLVFEQFTDAVSADNAFWIDSMRKMNQIDIVVGKLHREREAEY